MTRYSRRSILIGAALGILVSSLTACTSEMMEAATTPDPEPPATTIDFTRPAFPPEPGDVLLNGLVIVIDEDYDVPFDAAPPQQIDVVMDPSYRQPEPGDPWSGGEWFERCERMGGEPISYDTGYLVDPPVDVCENVDY